MPNAENGDGMELLQYLALRTPFAQLSIAVSAYTILYLWTTNVSQRTTGFAVRQRIAIRKSFCIVEKRANANVVPAL